MLVSLFSRLPASRCALEVTFLNEKGFIDLFDSFGFFADCGCNGRDPDWPATELLDDGAENTVVHVIKPVLVHIQCTQSHLCDSPGDCSITFDLCEVTCSTEQGIRDPRCATAPPCNFESSILIDGCAEYS